MAYGKDLPIWRDSRSLSVEMELAVRSFPRYGNADLIATSLIRGAHARRKSLILLRAWIPIGCRYGEDRGAMARLLNC